MTARVPQKLISVGRNVGLGKLFHNQWFPIIPVCSYRMLFTAEALGIDGFEKQRNRVKQQFSGMEDKFRLKMKEFTSSDTKNMIFTEDLKNMLHLVDGKPEDLLLVHQMMKKFNQQNRHLRFGNYVFGPVVMRMYHHLNEAESALQVFRDPDLEGMFDQLGSYQILCDLLYRNQLYQQVIDVFDEIKKKQTQGTRFPRNVLILVFGSCYKLNNIQSYEYALKTLNEMKEVGSEPVRRVLTYACGLALRQNAPQVALEILSITRQLNYVTVRNLKILALADLNRPDDVLPILRFSLEFDNPNSDKRSTVCPDVLDAVVASVERFGNKEISTEFETIKNGLKDTNQISKETLESMLELEIDRPMKNPDGFNRQNMLERSFQIGRSTNLRPRQNPLYDRERRTILSE